jgi:membrane protease YdiL (CAAX protease family)
VALGIARYNSSNTRLRLAIAMLTCGVLAAICGEGIAAAEQVNPDAIAMALQSPAVDPGEARQTISISMLEVLLAAIGVFAVWLFLARRWYQLVRVPRRPKVITPPVGFILVLLLLVAGVIGMTTARTIFAIGSDVQLEQNPVRAYALLSAGSHVAQLLILLLVAVMWSQSRRPKRDPRPSMLTSVALGLAALLFFWPIVMLVAFLVNLVITLMTGSPVEPIAHDTLALFRDHPIDRWMALLIVLVVVTAPLIEEVMYRGVVQESLGQLGLSPWMAIVVTSVFFAVMHLPIVEWHALATLFTLSLGFGWLYEKTGRLAAPIAMHAAFNAGNLGLVMMGLGS